MARTLDDEAVAQIGTYHSTRQCEDLLAHDVAGLHFYTLNQAPLSLAVCRMLGLIPKLQEAA